MIVDSSVVVAIVQSEPDAGSLLEALRDAETLLMPAPAVLEVTIVLGRDQVERTTEFIRQLGIRPVDFTIAHLAVAQRAFASYGRGSGSPAKLNFGDCMVYALAKVTGEPLLFKGDDFTHTDVESARG